MVISPKNKDKNQDNLTKIIDLTSTVDSPVKYKTEKILFVEKKDELENIEKKENEMTHEEHEKQVEDSNNNEEGMKSQKTRTVKWRQKIEG